MPIYKKENAPYLVKINYTDKYGFAKQVVRQNKSTSTLAGAKKVEAELILKYSNRNNGTIHDINKITMDELIDDYLKSKSLDLRKSTVINSTKFINLYIINFFKGIRIEDIDVPLCNKWKIWMSQQKNSRTGKELSVEYKNDAYKVLSAILNYAVQVYNLPFNPLSRISRFKEHSIAKERIRYWTLDQFNSFINELEKYCKEKESEEFLNSFIYWGYYVEFHILYFCGLRKGESFCLRWNDIIKGKFYNSFKIFRSMNQKIIPYEITAPKNSSSIRTVPICARLQKVLDEHYDRYQKVYGFSDDWYICGGIEPVKSTALDNYKNKIATSLNLPKIRIHDFRHSFATLLINGDVNIKTISKWMGHATVDQTWNTYGHLYPEKENEALIFIDKINSNN